MSIKARARPEANARQRENESRRHTDYSPSELEREARMLVAQVNAKRASNQDAQLDYISWSIRAFSFSHPMLIVEVFNRETDELDTLTEAI